MPDLTPYIVPGVALGAVYAVSGIGIIVLFRATGALNFAFGAVGALGALISWTLINQVSWFPDALAYLICIAFGGLATLLYGVLFGPPLARRDPLVKALGTLGLQLILLGTMFWVWSDDPRTLTLPTTRWGFEIAGVRINWTQIMALAFCVLVTVGTAVFLRRTRLGTAMRSLANDREITSMLGVPVRRVEAAAWLGSGLICGAAGLLLANLVRLDGVALTFLVISAMAAAVIGQLRSLWITLVAGIVIGLIEAGLTPFTEVTGYRTMTPFVLAIIALLWVGRHRVVALTTGALEGSALRARAVGAGAGRAAQRARSGRMWGIWNEVASRQLDRGLIVAGLLAFVLLAIPELTSTFWVKVLTAAAIYAVVAAGAGLLYGRVGMISLCQIALLALGGWISARLLYGTNIPFPIVLLIAGGITGIIGIGIGLPALRLSGLYLALITLMAAGAIAIVLEATQFPNGGGGFLGFDESGAVVDAIRRPDIAEGETAFFRYAVIVAALVFLLFLLHVRGKPGRAWASIRQSEAAALAGGVNLTLYKLWAFGLAAFGAGVAGGLMAASIGRLSLFQFPTSDSIVLLAAVLMGGIFTLWGAMIAGLLLKLLPALLDDWGVPVELLTILFGVGLIQVLLTAPEGIAGQLPRDLARLGGGIRRKVEAIAGAREEAPR